MTLWGQADDHTWLTSAGRVDAPLLFDTSLKAKLAYWAAVDPLQLPGADLVTTVSAQPATVPAGSAVRYTITVTNQGDAATEALSPTADDLPAANVSLTSAVPTGARFESLSVPTGWTCTTPEPLGTGQVQCNSPSLDVDASAVFTLTVIAGDCSTPDAMPILASATATSTTRDPNPAENNTASASARITNPPPAIDLHDLVILLPGLRIVVNGQTLVINGQAVTFTGRTLRVLGQTITFNG